MRQTPIRDKLLGLLQERGKMASPEIAQVMALDSSYVCELLCRYERSDHVIRVGTRRWPVKGRVNVWAVKDGNSQCLVSKAFRIGPQSASVLQALEGGPLTSQQLADKLGGSKDNILKCIRRLIQAGMVEEAPDCEIAANHRPMPYFRRTAVEAPAVKVPQEQQDEDYWPRPDAEEVVRNAIRTAPRSVFDLGALA